MKQQELLKKICAMNPIKNNIEMSEQSFSKLFGELFQNELKYNVTFQSWIAYDGKKWCDDKSGMQAAQKARMFSDVMRVYTRNYFKPDNEDEERKQKDFYDYVWRYRGLKNRETLVKDARSVMTIKQEEFNKNPNLLNCQNVTLDLSTMETHEHTPDDLLTRVCGCDYDTGAVCSNWIEFIDQIMQGNKEKIAYLKRMCGYSLTAQTNLEKAFILYGSLTRNGKSTFVETFHAMMGDYARVLQPESLELISHKNGSQANPDIAALDGVRFVSVPEPRENMILDVALFKAITGGDTIRARNLYDNGGEFVPQFKVFIHCNHLPVVTDNTLFKSDRVRIITFDKFFEEKEQNPNLKIELRNPMILSSVLKWAIEGLNDWKENGEAAPACVIMSTDKYKAKSDKIMLFFEECMKETNQNTTGKDVYTVYIDWCKENGYGIESSQRFFKNMRDYGLLRESATVNGVTVRNVVVGYTINDTWIDTLQKKEQITMDV